MKKKRPATEEIIRILRKVDEGQTTEDLLKRKRDRGDQINKMIIGPRANANAHISSPISRTSTTPSG
tara:strand:+ start:28 stop:228 length:201 start_codon:yes stop_codon:yes gene_type:complete